MPKLSGKRYLVQVSVSPGDYEILRFAAYKEGVTVNKYLLEEGLKAARDKKRR